jgi:hypothetical protein
MEPTAHTDHITPYWIVQQTEEATGLRYCNGACKSLLPLSKFRSKQKPKTLCHECHKQKSRDFFNTTIRLAYNSLVCRARSDTHLFKQTKMNISMTQFMLMVTPAQMENFAAWAIVPKDPLKTVSHENSTVILSYQRRFLISRWKRHQEPERYAKELMSLPLET